MFNIKNRFGGGGTPTFTVLQDGRVLRSGEEITHMALSDIAAEELPKLCWAASVHDPDGYSWYHEILAARNAMECLNS